MKWLTDIFGSKIVEDIGGAIDKLSTSSEEKGNVKNKLSEIVFKGLNKMQEAQRDVIVAEVTGNKIQRMWRPIVMLTFAFIVTFHFFIYPLIKTFNPYLPDLPVLETYFWELLKLGLGGYVIGRSVEKVAATVTKNTDLNLLRRKDRRKAMEGEE